MSSNLACLLLLCIPMGIAAAKAKAHSTRFDSKPAVTVILTERGLKAFGDWMGGKTENYLRNRGRRWGFTLDPLELDDDTEIRVSRLRLKRAAKPSKVSISTKKGKGIVWEASGMKWDLGGLHKTTLDGDSLKGPLRVKLLDAKLTITMRLDVGSSSAKEKLSDCRLRFAKGSVRTSRKQAALNRLLRKEEDEVLELLEAELEARVCSDVRQRLFPKFAAVLFRQPAFVTKHSQVKGWQIRMDDKPVKVYYGEQARNEVAVLYRGRFTAESPEGEVFEGLFPEPDFPDLPLKATKRGRKQMMQAFVSPLAVLSFVAAKQRAGQWSYLVGPGSGEVAEGGDDIKPYLLTTCDGLCAGTFIPELEDLFPDHMLEVLSTLERGTTEAKMMPKENIMKFRNIYRIQLWLHDLEEPAKERIDLVDSYIYVYSRYAKLHPERNSSKALYVTDSFEIDNIEVINATSFVKDVDVESLRSVLKLASDYVVAKDEEGLSALNPGVRVPQALRFPLDDSQSKVLKEAYSLTADYKLPKNQTPLSNLKRQRRSHGKLKKKGGNRRSRQGRRSNKARGRKGRSALKRTRRSKD